MKYFYPKYQNLHKPKLDLSDGLPGCEHLEVSQRVDGVLKGLLRASDNEVVYIDDISDNKGLSISHFKRNMGAIPNTQYRGIKFYDKTLLKNYLDEYAIAIVGTPNYICPACKEPQKKVKEGDTNPFRNIIPMNVLENFFDLSSLVELKVATRG